MLPDVRTEAQWEKVAQDACKNDKTVGDDVSYKIYFCPFYVECPRILFQISHIRTDGDGFTTLIQQLSDDT